MLREKSVIVFLTLFQHGKALWCALIRRSGAAFSPIWLPGESHMCCMWLLGSTMHCRASFARAADDPHSHPRSFAAATIDAARASQHPQQLLMCEKILEIWHRQTPPCKPTQCPFVTSLTIAPLSLISYPICPFTLAMLSICCPMAPCFAQTKPHACKH